MVRLPGFSRGVLTASGASPSSGSSLSVSVAPGLLLFDLLFFYPLPPEAVDFFKSMPKEIDALTKLYDFILWMIPKLVKYPRSHKFLLADRIENLLLDILDLLIEAAYSRKKDELLRAANLKLEKLRYLIRLSKDLRFLNIKSYEFSSNAINSIGNSIGGWLKYTKREDV
jgi:hypothetical protein